VGLFNVPPKLPSEADFVWTAFGIPAPVREYKFWPGRRFRFDYAWLAEKIAVEIEGGNFIHGRHSRGAGMRSDIEKYNEATMLGWKVYRFLPEQLKKGSAQTFMQRAFKEV
jgi:very-short-patch-repair endonuclease